MSSPDTHRRRVIWLSAGLVAGLATRGASAADASTRPKAGDLLAADDTEGVPAAIKAADVKAGKPQLAFPFAPEAKQVRSDSRFNKLVLVRVDEADLDADSKARAAGGVLAFSSVCTHQSCDVKTWVAADKSLVCFCHSSKFMPLEGARVAAGPAPRALPYLPLKLGADGTLVVAGEFSATPGGQT